MQTGRYFAILAVLTALGGSAPMMAEEISSMTEEQRKNALFLDELSIPSAGEVFAALNKACRPNWAPLVTPATAPVSSDRVQLALAVGVLSANGYIAVEAQDGQQVKNVGREIMVVAKALGVSQSLLGRGNSLMEFADNNAWDALAGELEATENEVKSTMIEQQDKNLIILTSAAAWLRGLEVASGVVLGSDSLQGGAVIRQPELARHIADELEALPERMKKGRLIQMVRATLESSASLLENSNPSKDAERKSLEKIHADAAAVVQAILTSSVAVNVPAVPQPATSAVTSPTVNAVTQKTAAPLPTPPKIKPAGNKTSHPSGSATPQSPQS